VGAHEMLQAEALSTTEPVLFFFFKHFIFIAFSCSKTHNIKFTILNMFMCHPALGFFFGWTGVSTQSFVLAKQVF
jgi:hypothetical protein